MTFQEFNDLLAFFLREEFARGNNHIFLKGYRASTELEKNLIQRTNYRYSGKTTNTMSGSFLFSYCPNPAFSITSPEINDNSVGTEQRTIIQRFNLKTLYRLSQVKGFEHILAHIRRSCQISDQVKTGEHVNQIIRPLNYSRNRKMLKNGVYRRYGDVALSLYYLFSYEEGLYLSGHVPKEACTFPDSAIEAAFENTEHLHPATVYAIVNAKHGQSIRRVIADSGRVREYEGEAGDYLIISGDGNPNGAVSFFFPGVMDRIFDFVGGPYYAVFPRHDSAIIHDAKRKTVQQVKVPVIGHNALSKHVFLYNGKGLIILHD